ncbi:MAG: acyl-CoA thioesterase [Clostridium sp.]|nr:acyl-CoA thioesterase [Clostridium sp.]
METDNRTTPRFIVSDNPKVPKTDYPFSHCVGIQLRFSDIDVFGHVNNNHYMSMLDLGKVSYFRDLGRDRFDYRNIPAVVANIDISFFAPTMFDEPVEVWTTAASIGTRSFTLDQRLVNSATGEVKCAARSIMCCITPDGHSAPVDPLWREAVADYERREF